MLIFDQQHYEATKVYTLTTPDRQMSFTFENALEAKAFIDYYYKNPVAAMFAYEMSQNSGLADMAGHTC